MDGPCVNWNVLEKLDDYLMNKDLPETTDIGGCNQHIFHGALQFPELPFKVLDGILIKY